MAFATCQVSDDEGHSLTLQQPAQRIISLAPDLTELLFAAGAGEKIVGVMQASDYPLAAVKIPVVGSYNQLDLEKIVELHPDLIVAWGESTIPPILMKLHIPIFISHQKKLTDIPRTLDRLSCLAGTEAIGHKAAEQFQQRYQQLENKFAHQKPVTVFYELYSKPLITVTQSSWINDVINLCGGQNIFANLSGVAPEINPELILQKNPQVIIISSPECMIQCEQKKLKTDWDSWHMLTAVKQHQIFFINPDIIERASPRVLAGAEQVCQFIEASRQKKE